MSPRYSTVSYDHISYSLWLVFDDAGGVRLSRGAPALKRNERGISLTAKLPKALFQTPSLSASLTVAEPSASWPPIDLQLAQDALRSALGIDVDLRVNEQERPDD